MPNGRHAIAKECYSKYKHDTNSFHCLNRMDMKSLFSTKLHEEKKSNAKFSINLNTDLKFDENGFSRFRMTPRLFNYFLEERVSWKNLYKVSASELPYYRLSEDGEFINSNVLLKLIIGDFGFKGRHYLEKNGLLE